MAENIAILLMDLSAYSILVPILIGGLAWSTHDQSQRLLFWLVLISGLFEVLALVVGALLDLRNLPLLHLFTIIQTVLLAKLYQQHLQPLIAPRTMNMIIISFIVIASLGAIYADGLLRFNSSARVLESLLLIIFSLLYFYKTLRELKIKRLEQEPIFWISTGILIYFSGNFLIFICCNYIITSNPFLFTAWGLHAILNICLNLLFTIALLVNQKSVKTIS